VLAAVHHRSGGQVLESSLPLVSGAVDGVGSSGRTADEVSTSEVAYASIATEAPVPSGLPLLMSVQTWWRGATRVAGTQAGREVRRAGVLSRFPVWAQAVTDGHSRAGGGAVPAGRQAPRH